MEESSVTHTNPLISHSLIHHHSNSKGNNINHGKKSVTRSHSLFLSIQNSKGNNIKSREEECHSLLLSLLIHSKFKRQQHKITGRRVSLAPTLSSCPDFKIQRQPLISQTY